jgi:hypothetical protein
VVCMGVGVSVCVYIYIEEDRPAVVDPFQGGRPQEKCDICMKRLEAQGPPGAGVCQHG